MLLFQKSVAPLSGQARLADPDFLPCFERPNDALHSRFEFMKPDDLDVALVRGRYRINGSLQRGEPVTILVDGRAIQAYAGESVMAALVASGRICFGRTPRRNEPRGPYCGIGICFDCVMTVNDRLNVRTCQTPVSAGMRVETQGGSTQQAEPR